MLSCIPIGNNLNNGGVENRTHKNNGKYKFWIRNVITTKVNFHNLYVAFEKKDNIACRTLYGAPLTFLAILRQLVRFAGFFF